MSSTWFVNIGGETFGPLSTEVVNVMLRQTRLHFTDFIWQKGLTKWVRIADVDVFVGLLPPYPKTSIPSESDQSTPKIKPPPAPIPRTGQIEAVPKETKPEAKQVARTSNKLSAFPRVKVVGKLHLSTGSYYKIIDISEGGVFVASKEPMEIGTDLQFDLQIEGFPENLSMVGVVIRHGDRDQHPGFAIEFMRVNPAYKRMLQTFINEELSKK